MPLSNSRQELYRLLQERNEHPEKRTTVDQLIHQTFEQTHAIFVLDMAGFTRVTAQYGIIHFLSMIRRMVAIASPIVEHHQGRIVKQEADNLFAVFPQVDLALESAIAILRGFTAVNTGLPDDMDIFASIGIGYGPVLMVDDEDMYGSEMNIASKLGEDLAQRGEILLTETAFKQLDPQAWEWEAQTVEISAYRFPCYKMRFSDPLRAAP